METTEEEKKVFFMVIPIMVCNSYTHNDLVSLCEKKAWQHSEPVAYCCTHNTAL